ncbi:hypothetical protein LLH06_02175 [Mucilaginibacter daejeonensis]|nr:hypothetical protein [Mucilaginibacter daejeonensis]UEG53779.1 hypothetical protein LLH06_02175 [Mucilaginibacter daejeonensis]
MPNDTKKNTEQEKLETQQPISEKDEVKKAEDRTREQQKKAPTVKK